jgi:hypothetical protein
MTDARDHEAHHKIDTHEKVCAERYGNLWSAVQRIEATILTHNATADTRMTALSNRMWALVIGGASAGFLGLAAVVFHLLTRGKI